MTADERVTTTGTRPVFLITGATGGIGEAIATRLASVGGRVLIGARSAPSGHAAAARIRGHADPYDCAVDVIVGDLSDMAQVRAMAEQVRERTDRLDGMVLNAGEIRHHRELTADGFETMFATNYLSGFLLTALLWPLLADSAPARVITTSSRMHSRVTSLNLPSLATGADFDRTRTYEATKLLAAAFAVELARRAGDTGVTVNAADPGFVRTNLGRHTTGAFRFFLTLTRPLQSSPWKAAGTACYLATAPQVADATGGYDTKSRPGKPNPLSRDPELGQQLWTQSITLLTAAKAMTPDELKP